MATILGAKRCFPVDVTFPALPENSDLFFLRIRLGIFQGKVESSNEFLMVSPRLSGTGDSHGRFVRIDSRESFAIETPIFAARQANSHESLEFPIRANHATKFRSAAQDF